jgi:hypothetical protein
VDVVERRARIGIELIDALTGSALLGGNRLSVEGAEALRATASRWFVEDGPLQLGATARVIVEADGYVTETVDVAVPPPGDPATLVEVRMVPRTGYPFPPSLTRVVGLVRFDDSGAPVRDAAVTVTPRHGGTDGAPLLTRTTDDGQFAMWFLPLPSITPPLADGYRIDAQIVVDGVTFTGSLPPQPLAPNRRNDAPVLRLTP